jgi:hypothetical protein
MYRAVYVYVHVDDYVYVHVDVSAPTAQVVQVVS